MRLTKLRLRPFMMLIMTAVLIVWGLVVPANAVFAATGPMCGQATSAAQPIKHVVEILMENTDYTSVVGNPAATFQHQVANECGTAANMHGLTHPSLENYMALVEGTIPPNMGGDCGPTECSSQGTNVFKQIDDAGLSWKAYEEDMQDNCQMSDSGKYAPRHNPPVYYPAFAASCKQNDVPMGTLTSGPMYDAVTSGKLPNLTFITPNNDHNAHDSQDPIVGDKYLSELIPFLTAGKDFQRGDTVIFITNDEGRDGNQVPSFVLAPTVRAGLKVTTQFDHYSMLRTVEELLGLPLLGQAASATSMTKDFGLVAGKPVPGAKTTPAKPNPQPTSAPTPAPSPSATPSDAGAATEPADSADEKPSPDANQIGQTTQPPVQGGKFSTTPVKPLIICAPKDGKPIHLSFAPDVVGDALWIRIENC